MPITVQVNPRQVAWSHFRPVDSIPGSSENAQINPMISGLQTLNPVRTRSGRFRLPSLTLTVGINAAQTLVLNTAEQTDELLAHEQRHYEIQILAARAMAREMETLEAPTTDGLLTLLQQAQTTHNDRAQALQDAYDSQTRHGADRDAQTRWDTAVGQALREPRATQLMTLPL